MSVEDVRADVTREKDPMKVEFLVMKSLLNGRSRLQILQPKLTTEEETTAGVTARYLVRRTHQLVAEGVISGWVPVLTEQGKARWDVLRTLYDGDEP